MGSVPGEKQFAIGATMITGFHAIVYSSAVEEVRAFFRDTLGLPVVDAGGGWLISCVLRGSSSLR